MTLKEMLYGFVILKETGETRNKENLYKEINQHISDHIGPVLIKFSLLVVCQNTFWKNYEAYLRKKIAEGDYSNFGDISTLLNPEIVGK
jgi:acetyl-CoA synthetase